MRLRSAQLLVSLSELAQRVLPSERHTGAQPAGTHTRHSSEYTTRGQSAEEHTENEHTDGHIRNERAPSERAPNEEHTNEHTTRWERRPSARGDRLDATNAFAPPVIVSQAIAALVAAKLLTPRRHKATPTFLYLHSLHSREFTRFSFSRHILTIFHFHDSGLTRGYLPGEIHC